MTRFWLVRHGPTHARGMVGWTDLPADLSDLAALGRLNDFLPRDAPVISSDLNRAVATADVLGRRRLAHDPGLREMNFGAWEMRLHAELEAESPDLIRAFWENPGVIRPPGGESWLDMSTRVCAALDRLNGEAPEVIVVAHFGPILAGVQRALKASACEVLAHRIDNLSVTCLEIGAGTAPGLLHRINHIP